MEINSLRAMVVAVAFSAVSAFATTPPIGVATAIGPFVVNNAQVSGNANILDGSEVKTGKSASEVILRNGSSLTIGSNSSASVYADHLALEQGTAKVDRLNKYPVTTAGYRVQSDDAKSEVAVRMNEGTFEVASLMGSANVFNEKGALLTRVGAGTSASFGKDQSGAGAGGGTPAWVWGLVGAAALGLGVGLGAYFGDQNGSSTTSH